MIFLSSSVGILTENVGHSLMYWQPYELLYITFFYFYMNIKIVVKQLSFSIFGICLLIVCLGSMY